MTFRYSQALRLVLIGLQPLCEHSSSSIKSRNFEKRSQHADTAAAMSGVSFEVVRKNDGDALEANTVFLAGGLFCRFWFMTGLH